VSVARALGGARDHAFTRVEISHAWLTVGPREAVWTLDMAVAVHTARARAAAVHAARALAVPLAMVAAAGRPAARALAARARVLAAIGSRPRGAACLSVFCITAFAFCSACLMIFSAFSA
jgi:hypothetical protein